MARSMNATAFALAFGLFLVGTGAADAAHQPGCRIVHARLTLEASTDPGCPSAIGLCATGILQGSLRGNSEFVGTSSAPTVDTAVTSVILLTGDNVIHTSRGDLFTKDAIVLATTGNGEFAEVDTIVGGTGDYVGASGQLIGTGTFANGTGEGLLVGTICQP